MRIQKKYFILILLLFFLLSIPLLVYIVNNRQRVAELPVKAAACNDRGCANVKNGNYWMITDCNNANDPDGDEQLCSWKARVGICGGKNYCCPDQGQKWTTDMTACPTPTSVPSASPTPTNTPTNTPTPTSAYITCIATPTPYYMTSGCNGSCMSSVNCTEGRVCILAEGAGWVCRNPGCVGNSGCSCNASPTPTPNGIGGWQTATCNQWCDATTDCGNGLQCIVYGTSQTCRNPNCPALDSCTCIGSTLTPTPTLLVVNTNTPTPTLRTDDKGGTSTPTPTSLSGSIKTPTPTLLNLGGLPTPTPIPTGIPVNPSLTIKPFADKNGQTSQTFTLSGTSDPFLEIGIRVDPDGFGHTTTADAKGDWRLILTKSLAEGKKTLTVTARTNEGGETQLTQSFTVKRGGSGSIFGVFIGFIILGVLGAIGFFIYKKQMDDQSSLFTNFPSTTSVPPPYISPGNTISSETNPTSPSPDSEIKPESVHKEESSASSQQTE